MTKLKSPNVASPFFRRPSCLFPGTAQRQEINSAVRRASFPMLLAIGTCVAVLVVLQAASPVQVWSQDATADGEYSDGESETTDQRVHELIEKLGSDSYATRLRARNELQRMGLEAFDALREAQTHSDSEILSAARFLISSLHVAWAKETDPAEVREALAEYGAQDASERESRIHILASLPDRKGLHALVRLARFESNIALSRLAALLAMKQNVSEDRARQISNAERIREMLRGNQRQASQWLLAYADDLREGQYSESRWQDLIHKQRSELDNALSQTTHASSVLELVRVSAARAAEQGQTAEALRLAIENADLVPARTRGLIDACEWAIDHELFPFVSALQQQHQHVFESHALLMYSAAHAHLSAGEVAKANELAERAAAIRKLPEDETQRTNLSDKEFEEMAYAHMAIGEQLEQRGLFDWAEKEYRLVIDSSDLEMNVGVQARQNMSKLCEELLRHDDAVKWLEPVVERAEKDNKFQNRISILLLSAASLRSKVEYQRALSQMKSGQIDAAKKSLVTAINANPTDINIIITMMQIDDENDPAWTAVISRYWTQSIGRLKSDIASYEARMRRGIPIAARDDLAESLNQYAWLVSNTKGDFQEALRASQRSLVLSPGSPEFLDTLARCHFAVGDVRAAVATQKEALKVWPHSPPLKRQLKEFEAALQDTE
ncbi:tetratricopeptide repeat protein [Stieleria varia]|nr:hypothetical protein [Stieleria varia]